MIGQVLNDRFEVVQEVEGDNVFSCFKARDKSTGKDVYLRVVRSPMADEQEFVMTLREVVASVSQVKHPGVEKLFGLNEHGDSVYVASEYFAGTTLESRLKRLATLSVPVAISIIIEVCDAVEALHRQSIVHGNVSANTVMTTSTDGVKMVLPGFWRAYSHSKEAAVAGLKEMAPYLAPEVTAGGMPTQISDVYAIGVLLWRILAGRFPYHGGDAAALAERHSTEAYPSLRETVAAVPEALDQIVKKAMAKNPLMRHGSVSALRHDLKQVQDALRFGRPLTWTSAGTTEIGDDVAEVAPRMNAVEQPAEAAKPTKKVKRRRDDDDERYDSGVPIWLSGLFYISTTLCLLAVGGWAFFNLQKPKPIKVPAVIGKQVSEARDELAQMGLKLREVRREENDKYAAGEIISLSPSPDENVYQNTYVEAVVSSGSRTVTVPDFRGRTLEETIKLAQSSGLQIDEGAIQYVRDRDAPKGQVLSHVPEARKEVERSTRIVLTVSNGNVRTDEPESPRHYYRVVVQVPNEVEGSVIVRVDMTDDRGTKTVYDARHQPGDEIAERFPGYGSQVIFRIFFDGELVKQVTQEAGQEE